MASPVVCAGAVSVSLLEEAMGGVNSENAVVELKNVCIIKDDIEFTQTVQERLAR